MTRSRGNVKTIPASAVANQDAGAEAKIAYTNGTLPEIWIASEGAEQFELISLPDPKTSEPRQFVYSVRRKGNAGPRPYVGELKSFAMTTPASFLVEVEGSTPAEEGDEVADEKRVFATKQTLRMVTDIDVAFLLLPAICPKSDKHGETRATFVPFDDIMEAWSEMKGSQASRLVTDEHVKGGMEEDFKAGLERICDSVDAGGEIAYRFSLAKFEKLVLDKAVSLVNSGLPDSLEDRAMQLVDSIVPVVAATESDSPVEIPLAVGTPGELSVAASETQESTMSTIFSQGESSVPTLPSVPSFASQTSAGGELESLARMRIALGFVMANYVPPSLSEEITKHVDERSAGSTDFKPLREHVERKRESERRMEAVRNVSHKRGAADDELMEERAEKKRKLEEEEKKKKSASAGVKALAKVNTKGMSKMSSFFKAKPKK